MHCRTIGIGYTPQGVKLGDDPKPAIWGLRFESLVNSDRYWTDNPSSGYVASLRALLIQIGIEPRDTAFCQKHRLRALLIQIGIEPSANLDVFVLGLRALLIQIGIELSMEF